MIHLKPREPADDAWYAWKRRARAARRQLVQAVAAGNKPVIDAALYAEQKQAIVSMFHGKCVYCEVPIEASHPGDIEHYRPKARVTAEAEETDAHEGYYWLAYYWRNLLLSCEKCNRPSTEKGVKLGKRNRFPVAGARAKCPYQDLKEKPLLLNPTVDDPAKHLKFNQDGTVTFLSERGRATIEVLGLNREPLQRERKMARMNLESLLIRITNAIVDRNEEMKKELTAILDAILDGSAPFSAPARTRYREIQEEMRATLPHGQQ